MDENIKRNVKTTVIVLFCFWRFMIYPCDISFSGYSSHIEVQAFKNIVRMFDTILALHPFLFSITFVTDIYIITNTNQKHLSITIAITIGEW